MDNKTTNKQGYFSGYVLLQFAQGSLSVDTQFYGSEGDKLNRLASSCFRKILDIKRRAITIFLMKH